MYQLDKEGSLKPEKITLCGHYMLHSGQDSIHLKPPLNLALNTVEVANSSMLKVKKKAKQKTTKQSMKHALQDVGDHLRRHFVKAVI